MKCPYSPSSLTKPTRVPVTTVAMYGIYRESVYEVVPLLSSSLIIPRKVIIEGMHGI